MIMKVVHIVDAMNKNMGGPTFSVAELTQMLIKQDVAVDLFSVDYPFLGECVYPKGVQTYYFKGNRLGQYCAGINLSLRNKLFQQTHVDLIHHHGIWRYTQIDAKQFAQKNNIPFVLSPRGMLEPWALSYKAFKKNIAWKLWQKKCLDAVTMFHATAETERDSIRRLGFTQPIAVIPNGIQMPLEDKKINQEMLEQKFPDLKNKKWLLFMSRIDVKKGIDQLLLVWKDLHQQYPEWQLILAGPENDDYHQVLKKFITQHQLTSCVTFVGMLSGLLKECVLQNAQIFVLPTHSENFGRVIAEALSYQVPVITTKQTPWQDIEQYRCGWWIDDDSRALKKALIEALDLPVDIRKDMGYRGRDLIKTKYSLSASVLHMKQAYQWLLGHDNKPTCLYE